MENIKKMDQWIKKFEANLFKRLEEQDNYLMQAIETETKDRSLEIHVLNHEINSTLEIQHQNINKNEEIWVNILNI